MTAELTPDEAQLLRFVANRESSDFADVRSLVDRPADLVRDLVDAGLLSGKDAGSKDGPNWILLRCTRDGRQALADARAEDSELRELAILEAVRAAQHDGLGGFELAMHAGRAGGPNGLEILNGLVSRGDVAADRDIRRKANGEIFDISIRGLTSAGAGRLVPASSSHAGPTISVGGDVHGPLVVGNHNTVTVERLDSSVRQQAETLLVMLEKALADERSAVEADIAKDLDAQVAALRSLLTADKPPRAPVRAIAATIGQITVGAAGSGAWHAILQLAAALA